MLTFLRPNRKEGLAGYFQLLGSTNTSGFETSIPYYFNLSPTYDATTDQSDIWQNGVYSLMVNLDTMSENFAGTSQIQYLNKDR